MKRENVKEIMPLQPYIVINTSEYRNLVENNHGISHFYEFTATGDSKKHVQAVPDGSVDLLFGISDSQVHTYIGGTVLQAKKWSLYEGETYFGVRFLPGKCMLPADLSIDEIINEDVEISGDYFARNLAEEIAQGRNIQERSDIFRKRYMEKISGKQKENPAKRLESYVTRRIYESKGTIAIRELGEETGYSECYIRRIFQQIHGVSPKTFEKFVRFQNVLSCMNHEAENTGFEELALLNGYYDQSHMINEFKKFTGKTPEAYLQMISGTNLIEFND